MTIQAFNPANGQLIREYPAMPPEQVADAVEAAHTAFQDWRRTSFADRGPIMREAARVLDRNKDRYARLMTEEMGKPIKESRAEIEKCGWVCEYYAEHAEGFLTPLPVETDARRSFVAFPPLGVVLAVMPWNFPFWQVFRFAAPGIMAGNAGLLKHASNVPGCALAIEEVFREAGLPQNVFQTLLVGSDQVEAVIENPLVRAVTLTGSVPAGRAVAEKAGRMLKKTVLELGGSDPYVVLEDADLDATVSACVTARLINSGQSCIAAKRFVVTPGVRQEFERRFVENMSQARMGDPLKEETTVGPQARRELRDELHEQVRQSLEKGARLLLGGEIPPGEGAFYPPTVLTDVNPGMPAFDEEMFGPAAAVVPARDERDALRLANHSPFGLGAAVFTRDRERGERLAVEELEAGCCFVNDFVRSDPRLPFGGIKDSGYGRELGEFGIREFVNIKTVYVARAKQNPS